MEGVNPGCVSEVIRVKRDSIIHSWAMAVGDHWMPLPWKETADAVSVVLWVKEQSSGATRPELLPPPLYAGSAPCPALICGAMPRGPRPNKYEEDTRTSSRYFIPRGGRSADDPGC